MFFENNGGDLELISGIKGKSQVVRILSMTLNYDGKL